MRQSVRLGIENLESRFAPASVAIPTLNTSVQYPYGVTSSQWPYQVAQATPASKLQVLHIQPELDDDI
jgi:hypothetical protein